VDVLSGEKPLGINISQACDNFLREHVRKKQERQWLAENASFSSAYNQTVEHKGLPLDQYRAF
jgi:antitoxin CcdA